MRYGEYLGPINSGPPLFYPVVEVIDDWTLEGLEVSFHCGSCDKPTGPHSPAWCDRWNRWFVRDTPCTKCGVKFSVCLKDYGRKTWDIRSKANG